MAEGYTPEGQSQENVSDHLAKLAEEGKKERAEKGEPSTPEESADVLGREKEAGRKERVEKGEPSTPEESVEVFERARETGEAAQQEAVETAEAAKRQAEEQIEEVRQEIEEMEEVTEESQEIPQRESHEPLPGIDAEYVPDEPTKGPEKLPAKPSFGAKVDKGVSSVGLGFIGGTLMVIGAAAKYGWKVFDKLIYSTWLKPLKDLISSVKPESSGAPKTKKKK